MWPALSIVVPPTGQCCHLVSRLISLLSIEAHGETFPPHLTLQTVYKPVREREVLAVVKRVALETEAFEARAGGIGLLDAIYDPGTQYLHLKVVKTRKLARLHQQLRMGLRAIGATTYPFSTREWTPHLTVASGHWSAEESAAIKATLAEYASRHHNLECRFLVRIIEVHRHEENGQWRLLAQVPLARPRQHPEDNLASA